MMKIGINIKLDVTRLDKNRFFKGAKGTYCDLTAFVDTETVSQYGDNGSISQATTKEERGSGAKMPICGNVKVFYKAESEQGQGNQPPAASRQERGNGNQSGYNPEPPPGGGFDDSSDIPF